MGILTALNIDFIDNKIGINYLILKLYNSMLWYPHTGGIRF